MIISYKPNFDFGWGKHFDLRGDLRVSRSINTALNVRRIGEHFHTKTSYGS